MVQRLVAVVWLALSLNAAALSADDEYRAAQTAARALRADPARRQYRHHWLNAARGFEHVASKYRQTPRAPEALLAAAQLLEELSRLSGRSEDLDRAVGDWKALIERHPEHAASTAAALALARVYLQRRQPEAARHVLTSALGRHPSSPSASEMKSLLASPPKRAPGSEPSGQPSDAVEPTLVHGRRTGTAVQSRTRELLDAIARAAAGGSSAMPLDPPPAAAAGEEPVAEEARELSAQPKEPASVGERAPVKTEAGTSAAASPAENRGPPAPVDPVRRARALRAGAQASKTSIAQQLGLKIHRVVLDPGHGGHDTGAIGRKGTKEKDVALAVALRVRDRLARAGLEVILTRRDDSFVGLEERARIANAAKGDLFISIHCNSAPTRKLRGIETYTLNTSSDRYSIRLAARENASSDRSVSDLQYILADLATKANTEESSRLADRIQQSLVSQLRAKGRPVVDLGTKEALFYVLLGVRMPAILVETSFLSHGDEERLLSSKGYQAELAAAIASGIQDFLTSRQRLAKVD